MISEHILYVVYYENKPAYDQKIVKHRAYKSEGYAKVGIRNAANGVFVNTKGTYEWISIDKSKLKIVKYFPFQDD